jgi:hypothetical protein
VEAQRGSRRRGARQWVAWGTAAWIGNGNFWIAAGVISGTGPTAHAGKPYTRLGREGGLNIDRLRCGWAGPGACLAQACDRSGVVRMSNIE